MNYVARLATLLVSVAGLASSETISFVGFGTNVGTVLPNSSSSVNLGVQSISLLDGSLSITSATSNPNNLTLTQRGTRGLGIVGGSQNDEIDNAIGPRNEILTLNVLSGVWSVSSLELRSMYELFGISERAHIDIYNGSAVSSYDVFGTESTFSNGDGIRTLTFSQPVPFTQIQFSVAEGLDRSYSDFTVASVNVTPTPEPSSLLFMATGLGLVAVGLRRRASAR